MLRELDAVDAAVESERWRAARDDLTMAGIMLKVEKSNQDDKLVERSSLYCYPRTRWVGGGGGG